MAFIAEVLRQLILAGLEGEALVKAVEAIEQSSATERTSAALRQARYRERGGGRVPFALRSVVMERDNYECQDCGAGEKLEIDHIHPISQGGSDDIDNLQCLCRSCNARKGDRIRKRQSRTKPDKAGQDGTNLPPLVPPLNGFPNPSLNPPYNPPLQTIRRFDEFWSACLSKKGKGAARTAYLKASKKTDEQNLIDGMKTYVANLKDETFACHPATWLNQERWDDEYDSRPKTGKGSYVPPPELLARRKS